MSLLNYELIPLARRDGRGESYPIGHALAWHPQAMRMEFLISHETMARDFFATTMAPYYVQVEPWKKLAPHPGLTVREAIAQHPGGVAYFNAGESGTLINPLVENGQLLTKPQPQRALLQREWAPLNGTFAFFLQHAHARVEIRDLRIVQNQIHPDDLQFLDSSTCGFSVPYVLKNRARVPLKHPPPGCTSNSDETLYTLGAPAALSAIGMASDGRVVWIGLIGDVNDPGNPERLATEDDLVRYLRELDVVDALFAGASGDVQYYDAFSQTLGVACERPKCEDKRWVLKPGQTERGLACMVKLVAGQCEA